jgi:lipopolysaccharide transport system permease protein
VSAFYQQLNALNAPLFCAMQSFSSSPIEMVRSLWRNRGLIWALTKREVLGRYRGSVMGILWSFFNPLLMLGVYTFVFSSVFKARWAGGSDSKTEFALLLFAGMLVFGIFSECVNRAPVLILSNPNYVKKVVFPLEILPIVSLGAALFHLLVSILVWVLFYLVTFGVPKAGILLLPVVLFPFAIFVLGLSWLLAALGVYLRDISQFVGVLVMALLFLSPIFYPLSALPEGYREVIALSPITIAVDQARELMFWGKGIDWVSWSIYLGISLLVGWLGFASFQQTRRGFADVI